MVDATFTPPPPEGRTRWVRGLSRALLLLALGLWLMAGAQWLAARPYFSVRGIELVGDVSHQNPATVRAWVLPLLPRQFFSVDLKEAQAAFEKLPWVRQVQVSRVWPNRLRVRLEEHQAAAFWENPSAPMSADEQLETDRLVNTQGEIFEANTGDVEDMGLPAFQGADDQAALMLDLYRRLKPHFQHGDWEPAQLHLSSRNSWTWVSPSGVEVVMGRGTDSEIEARVVRFMATYPQITTKYERPLEYVDLRHKDAYALRLTGIETTASPGNKARK